MTDSYCTDFIKKINPVTYNLKSETHEGRFGKMHCGFIAQDVYKAGFEDLVTVVPEKNLEEIIEDDGFVNPKDQKFTLCYDQIIPILTKNIQMLLARVEQLEQQLKK